MKKQQQPHNPTKPADSRTISRIEKLLRLGDLARNAIIAEAISAYNRARKLMTANDITPDMLDHEFRTYDFSRSFTEADVPPKEKAQARQSFAKAVIGADIEALIAELKSGASDRLQSYLNFAALFHRYSTNNERIIENAARADGQEVRFVAGFNQWIALGKKLHGQPYVVRKGEQAIWIWGPMIVGRNADDPDDPGKLIFKLMPVFADYQIDQSEGQPPLASLLTPLQETTDHAKFYATLEVVAQDMGYRVTEQFGKTERAYTHRQQIWVNAALDAMNKSLAVLRELAYSSYGLTNSTIGMSFDLRECESEAVAYIVAHHFGLPALFSADFLHLYSFEEKDLLAQLERIRKIAHALIEKIAAARIARGDVAPPAVALIGPAESHEAA